MDLGRVSIPDCTLHCLKASGAKVKVDAPCVLLMTQQPYLIPPAAEGQSATLRNSHICPPPPFMYNKSFVQTSCARARDAPSAQLCTSPLPDEQVQAFCAFQPLPTLGLAGCSCMRHTSSASCPHAPLKHTCHLQQTHFHARCATHAGTLMYLMLLYVPDSFRDEGTPCQRGRPAHHCLRRITSQH